MRRFSLRFFLVVLTIAIVALGLWMRHVRVRRSALDAVLANGGGIGFRQDGQGVTRSWDGNKTVDSVRVNRKTVTLNPENGWARRLVQGVKPAPDPEVILLEGPTVTDELLRRHVLHLTNLKKVALVETNVTQ